MARTVSMQFGKPGGASGGGSGGGYYSPGETVKWSVYNETSPSDTPAGIGLPAAVYTAKAFVVSIILPKSLERINSATLNSFRGAIRSTGGLIGGSSMDWVAQWVGKSGFTIGVDAICGNVITFRFTSTSNITNATTARPATAEVSEYEFVLS